MQADDVSSAFDKWCHSRELAEHTLRAYQREGGRLRRWWSAPGTRRVFDEANAVALCDALSSDNEAVLASVGITRPLQTGSLLQAKRILGAFFLWLAQQNPAALAMAMHLKQWRPSAPIEVATCASASVPVVDVVALLAHTPDTSDSPRRLRDQWIRQLAFWSNASRGELAALCMNDIRVREDQLQVRLPDRNGSTTWTVLPHLCLDWWAAYRRSLPVTQGGSSPALRSLSRPTAGLTDSSISRIVAGTEPTRRAAGAGPTLRSLRHQFVALGYRGGLRESALARHMRLARAPVELADPSVKPAEAINLLADQLMSEARAQTREPRSGKARWQ